MSPTSRLGAAVLLLGLTLVLQLGLVLHLGADSRSVFQSLQRPLSELPREITLEGKETRHLTWIGETRADEQEILGQLPFKPDDMISRNYLLQSAGVYATLYMVHSRVAEDRKHHPEICIREVAGLPEVTPPDTLVLDGDKKKRPVRRFRFRTSPGMVTSVYYWHYTFQFAPTQEQSLFQTLHQTLGKPAPSITVQISTVAPENRLQAVETLVEQTFLVALDNVLIKEHLPTKVEMGCESVPIALVR